MHISEGDGTTEDETVEKDTAVGQQPEAESEDDLIEDDTEVEQPQAVEEKRILMKMGRGKKTKRIQQWLQETVNHQNHLRHGYRRENLNETEETSLALRPRHQTAT